jgi:hypothetical protein
MFGSQRVLWIACGALGRELADLRRRSSERVEIDCLPAELHNTPNRIPEQVRAKLEEAHGRFDRVVVAFADCGTGGRLDAVLSEHGASRLPGAHCYECFAGREAFAALHADEPGTFYLTDFLVHHFERLVIRGLGLDRHPELLPDYFGNYRRVVYLAQTRDPDLEAEARAYAERLGLAFEYRFTGLSRLEAAVRVEAVEAATWPS